MIVVYDNRSVTSYFWSCTPNTPILEFGAHPRSLPMGSDHLEIYLRRRS